MSTPALIFDMIISDRERFKGKGYLAGSLPPDPNPDHLDGRAKILNVPSRVRIVAVDRLTMVVVAGVRSAADGTWQIERLDPSRDFFVVGFNDAGTSNAAIQDWVRPALPAP
ncbi:MULTISPECIES: hypothetical protein [unclassified Pseudoxanthomonas]|uniref:hypothetical protein n=1 Tax=unclassified Pseudoxanthomonas TaxID=2645906 RepID=UPI00307F0ECA